MRAVLDALGRPGVARASLSYYRHLPDVATRSGRESWRLLRAPVQVPTLAITGALDGCMDAQLYDVAVSRTSPGEAFVRGIEVAVVDGAGHFVHQERPDAINALLINWLSRQA